MSADNDNDSPQLSSPDDSDSQTPHAALPTPDSQHRPTMPTSNSGSMIANANGKRPLNTISNGVDDNDDPFPANGKPRPDFPPRMHEQSGYSWSREEDAPGFSWLNRKALDEHNRALDLLVHKEYAVKARYGDPFEMADKEQAMINSLTQK